MRLDLIELKKGRTREIVFNETLELTSKDFLINHNVDRIDPFTLHGKVYYLDNKLHIHFHYKGMVHFVCDRCLSVFAYDLENEVSRELSEQDGFDVDWLVIKDGLIDLVEALEDDLVIQLPIQLTCSDECEGMCTTCGKNLNEGPCACEQDDIDPRFESLKNFFN